MPTWTTRAGARPYWRRCGSSSPIPRCSGFPAICSRPRSPPCHDAEVAYDEGLATRVRKLVGGETGVTEKKMFGGVAMLLNGNMAVGVRGRGLLVRTDPGEQDELLTEPGARI